MKIAYAYLNLVFFKFQGHSVDYNRFMASASPVIDRLDAWMVSWRAEVSQSLDRIQQQVNKRLTLNLKLYVA